ncbi:MAG: subtilisin family serine protease [Natronomonas sp.]|jgi:subtilisin family serine protease|uniref:S8 family peptidase n=1 Tax=Natronomonas sp. TaxID=2184060 RepID=UPI003989B542
MERNLTRRRTLRIAAAGATTGVLVGGGSAEGGAPERIVGTTGDRGSQAARNEAESVRRTLRLGAIGQAVAGRFSDEAVRRLRSRGDVRYVERDGTMEAIQTLPWGIDRVDADVLHGNGETGAGADIAIIDTGIDDDHPDLQANVGAGTAYVDCRGRNCNYPWSDDNDHGTHCAGIADAVNNSEGVVGVSTEATLHAVKVLDKNGSGSFSDVAAGIEYTADQGWDVGSLSLGASSGSQTVKDACQYAYDTGVLLVAAAGNDGPCTDCVGYPAAYSTVIAVSSTDEDDSLSSFSSTGPEVELAGAGGDIYSTVIGGYDTFSGTSMACPHVSGAGGQLMANGYTNTEARQRLQDTAEDIGLTDNEQGYGLLDAEAAVLDGGGSNDAPSCTIVIPGDGNTVSGTVTVQVDANDTEDDDTTLDVEVAIDSGTYQSAAYNSDSGSYEYDWDTTGVSDGDHTVDARATDSDGATTDASQVTVTVDNEADSAPTIDTFALTDDSNPQWTRYDVDWAVSDGDGDLATVTSELVDGSGNVLDSDESSVGGGSASGTHYVESKTTASEVVLTVTDSAGNSTSDSKSI